VAYSQNDFQIASGSRDRMVRLWDPISGDSLAIAGDFLAIVGDLHGAINGIAWCPFPGGSSFVAGCDDPSVRLWQLAKVDACHEVRLSWRSTCGELELSGYTIEGVKNLSRTSSRLLAKRGATGRPRQPESLREVGENVIATGSEVP
ncbi:hypothetical protein BGX28_005597, partial [Mortierella sp. GBA30]